MCPVCCAMWLAQGTYARICSRCKRDAGGVIIRDCRLCEGGVDVWRSRRVTSHYMYFPNIDWWLKWMKTMLATLYAFACAPNPNANNNFLSSLTTLQSVIEINSNVISRSATWFYVVHRNVKGDITVEQVCPSNLTDTIRTILDIIDRYFKATREDVQKRTLADIQKHLDTLRTTYQPAWLE